MADENTPLPGEPADASRGADLIRATLGRARVAASQKGLRPGQTARRGAKRRRTPGEMSGARPDGRDPQPFKASVDRLVSELGWQEAVAVGGAIGRWPAIVGEQIAQHARPLSFDQGVLTVVADSTAWASQLRLLAPRLLVQLAAELGDGVVTRLVIKGPSAPSWNKGRIRTSDGRGPRDTYG